MRSKQYARQHCLDEMANIVRFKTRNAKWPGVGTAYRKEILRLWKVAAKAMREGK